MCVPANKSWKPGVCRFCFFDSRISHPGGTPAPTGRLLLLSIAAVAGVFTEQDEVIGHVAALRLERLVPALLLTLPVIPKPTK